MLEPTARPRMGVQPPPHPRFLRCKRFNVLTAFGGGANERLELDAWFYEVRYCGEDVGVFLITDD